MKTIDTQLIAQSLIQKCLTYEREIDSKETPTEAEKRHRDFLRTIILGSVANTDTEKEVVANED